MAKEIEEHTQRARVSFQVKRTYNTGNYSSYSVDMGAWDDCQKGEDIPDAIERVMGDVQGKFEELCEKIDGKKGGKK